MPRAARSRHRVLTCGGGVAALEAALALQELAGERVELTLLTPEESFVYRPSSIAEPFGAGRAERFALAELAAGTGARLLHGELASVDVEAHGVLSAGGDVLLYDSLLVACGARGEHALPGALSFGGPGDARPVRTLLADIDSGSCRRVAFAVPAGVGWALPVYELALLTAAHVAERGIEGVQLCLVTPEEAPLEAFGRAASDAVAALLAERGIAVHTRRYPLALYLSQLLLSPPHGMVPADRVVTVPRPAGRPISGLPQDAGGFLRTDADGRVDGAADVYAAGDITAYPIKQGGLAAQQADAAAAAIARAAGADVALSPFDPVMRGLLVTGGAPLYLRREPGRGGSGASLEPPWWPAAKIAGRRLAPYLARCLAEEAAAV